MDHPLVFKERLWPGTLGWVSVLAFAGTLGLTMGPTRPWLAAGVGLAALAVGVGLASLTAARVEVSDGSLTAGAARIPARLLGAGQTLDREMLRAALGPGSDARDYVLLRSWLPGAVSFPVIDPADSTPRWVVSTRRPEALLAAVEAARAQAAHSEQIG